LSEPRAVLPPTEPIPTLSEFVYDYLRQGVLDGSIATGQPIRQEEIAKRLDVSRVPVREALKRLEAEGLVVLRPRRGYTVFELDPEKITDIVDICVMLEGRAGYEAARNRSDEDVAELEILLSNLGESGFGLLSSVDTSEISRWALAHRKFHEKLFSVSGRTNLCRLIHTARDLIDRYIRAEIALKGYLRDACDEHVLIFDAFRNGDAEKLGQLCSAHIQKTGEQILATVIRNEE